MQRNRLFNLITGGLAILIAAVSMAATPAQTTITLEFNPENFAGDKIDNPYFPLKPGTRFIYRGESEGTPTRNVTIVTRETKEILGVTTVVVHDIAYEEGVLVEDTFDWYAQDKDGNVWYFGEATKKIDEEGNVSTEGSWEAGVDGALPGIVMLADPQVGDTYQQENFPGEAEDTAEVIGFEDSFCVEYGCFDNVLVTKDWNPLEPGILEQKYYASGVGFISAVMVEGGDEQTELVRIRPRPDNDKDDD